MRQGWLAYAVGLAIWAAPLWAETDEAAWQAAQAGQDIALLQDFVARHPQSPHLAEAQVLLAKAITTARGMGLMPVQAVEGFADQQALINKARASGAAAEYQAYLAAYPQGLFADMAKAELALMALAAPETPPPASQPAETAPEPTAAVESTAEPAPADQPANPAAALAGLTFTTPFPEGEHVEGQSIADLIATATPQYAPIEGLPDAAWRDKTCANCHAWTEASLCDQATTYTKPTAAESLSKLHPLGETFKLGLQQWALGGCK